MWYPLRTLYACHLISFCLPECFTISEMLFRNSDILTSMPFHRSSFIIWTCVIHFTQIPFARSYFLCSTVNTTIDDNIQKHYFIETVNMHILPNSQINSTFAWIYFGNSPHLIRSRKLLKPPVAIVRWTMWTFLHTTTKLLKI